MQQNLVLGLRILRKSPGFTAIAVLSLALGTGANTAIFSAINALMLRSLPLPDPASLQFVSAENASMGLTGGGFSLAAYETFRDRNRSFSGITAFCVDGFTIQTTGEPDQIAGVRVSPNFLDVLGVTPLMGRGFSTAEGEPGGPAVVLISNALWQRKFASDPNILGKTITLNDEAYTVIGVMPPDFPFPFARLDAWVSRILKYTGFQPEQIRAGAGFLTAAARLKPGVSKEQAEAEAAVLFTQYRAEHPTAPDADPHRRITVAPLQESLVSGVRQTLLILFGAAGVVLLIACTNVASLILARATNRSRELALRAALGASRRTLVGQLLVEGILLASAGALIGVLIARWGVAWLAKSDAARTLPGYRPITIDLQALAFTVGISLLAGILCSLAPSIQVSRPDLNSVLREAGRGTTWGGRHHFTLNLLTAGQVALSVVLMIGATLLLGSFRNLQSVDPGFNPRGALTMNVNPPLTRYGTGAPRARFFQQLVERLSSIPGVTSVVASYSRPMSLNVFTPLLADGQPVVPIAQRPLAVWNGVTPGYFQTYGIPLLNGRDFTWADDDKAPRVAIVSRSLANRFWPGASAIGKHLVFTRFQVPFEIVGIVGDTHTNGLQTDPGMVVLTPYAQWTFGAMTLTLRTAGDPASFAKAAVTQVQAVDPALPVTGVNTVEELMSRQLGQQRQTLYLAGSFALTSLVLAIIGLYGVMAYAVAQRTTEIGIRQAIGAQRSDILMLIFRHALRLSAVGIAAGALGALALKTFIGRMLFRMSATDPAIFLGISAVFLMVTVAASYVPAWRATRVDPVEAMRQ